MINAGRKPVGTEPYNIPINELDRCAMEHDSVFSRNNNTEKMSKMIMDAWITFARTGNPNNESIPEWPVYTTKNRATMIFNLEHKVEYDPMDALREAWKGII